MNINFQIHYRAEYGQSLCVIEIQESILGWTEKSPLVLNCQGTDFWQVNVPISDFAGSIRYKYAIRVGEGQYIYEAGEPRILNLVESQKSKVERPIQIIDTNNLHDAVQAAYHAAKEGDTVLLSPCCASFDLFKSYEDRGEQFMEAVRKL